MIKKNKQKKQINLPLKHAISNNTREDNSGESDNGEDMLQMVDEDDIDFLKQAISNRSYKIFNKVKYSE